MTPSEGGSAKPTETSLLEVLCLSKTRLCPALTWKGKVERRATEIITLCSGKKPIVPIVWLAVHSARYFWTTVILVFPQIHLYSNCCHSSPPLYFTSHYSSIHHHDELRKWSRNFFLWRIVTNMIYANQVPCPQCVCARYCSSKCREEATRYHRYECGVKVRSTLNVLS